MDSAQIHCLLSIPTGLALQPPHPVNTSTVHWSFGLTTIPNIVDAVAPQSGGASTNSVSHAPLEEEPEAEDLFVTDDPGDAVPPPSRSTSAASHTDSSTANANVSTLLSRVMRDQVNAAQTPLPRNIR
jgi:hypothetical protein